MQNLEDSVAVASMIYNLVLSRVLPELDAMPEEASFSTRCLVVKVVMNISVAGIPERLQVIGLIHQWTVGPRRWQECVQQEIKNFVSVACLSFAL